MKEAAMRYLNSARFRARSVVAVALVASAVLFAQQPSKALQPAEVEAESDKVAAELGRQVAGYVNEIETALGTIDRSSFDPAAVVAERGMEVEALFAFVRDETAHATYAGAMRGPVGVLLDRTGNSLDRSLLLAELLRQARHEARLVRGELDAEATQRLLDAARERQATRAEKAGLLDNGNDQSIGALADALGLPETEVRRQAAAAKLTAQATAEYLAFATARQSEALLALVGDRLAAEDVQATDAVRDHWWVEVRRGEQWQALDVSFPDHAPADTATTASSRFGGTKGYDILPEDLPAELVHRLQIEVIATRLDGGRRTDEVALTTSVSLPENVLRPVKIGFLPLSDGPRNRLSDAGVPDDDAAGDHDIQAHIFKTLLGRTEWVPAVTVASTVTTQNGIRTDGTLNDSPNLRPQAGSEKLNDAAEALGGLGGFGGGADAAKTDRTHLVGVAIRYSLLGPGGENQAVERAVFDLGSSDDLDPSSQAVRLDRASAMASRTIAMPQVARPTPEVVAYIGLTQIIDSRGPLLRAAIAGARQDQAMLVDAMTDIVQRPLRLYQAMLLRHPDDAATPPMTRPALLADVLLATWLDGDTPGFATASGIDWISNLSFNAAPAAQLQQGVRDTLAESVVVRGTDAEAETASSNAAVFMDRSLAAGQSWSVIDDVDTLTDWPEAARSQVRSDLDAGFLVVASTDASSAAAVWWRIDPATGATVGMGVLPGSGTARGQEMGEYMSMLNTSMQLLGDIEAIAGILKGVKECGQKPPRLQGCCMLNVAWTNTLGVAAGTAGGAVGMSSAIGYVWGKIFGEITKGLDLCVLESF